MTNVAKTFATGSVGRCDLFSNRNDLIEAGGWTMEAFEKLVDTTSEKVALAEVKNDVDDAVDVGDLILTMPEIPWDSFEVELARTNWETHVSDCEIFRTCCGTAYNLESSIMLEECLTNIRDTHDTAATPLTNKFFQIVFLAPRVATSLNVSLAVTPKMSVAVLLAASLVSTAVPSDAVSPDISSLPSPVAQPKTLTPKN